MATDVGKIFEGELEGSFQALKASHLLGWHRFPDSHSASQVIQPQPSDYLLGLPAGSRLPLDGTAQRLVFLEAKASEKHRSLQKTAVRASQRGFIHFYAGMLQLPYLIAHYSTLTGALQLWDGRAVMADRLDKARLLAEVEVGDGRKLRSAAVQAAFVAFFHLPDKCKTVKLYNQLY